MLDDLEQRVLEFVGSHCGVPLSRIALTTRLDRDIGLAGDEGVEFIQAYASMFEVELGAFNAQRYFGSEGLDVVGALTEIVKHKRLPRVAPMTVQMLVDAARAGRWLDRGE